MQFSASLLAVALALQTAIAKPIQRRAGYAVKETSFLPRRWTRVRDAPSERSMVFSFGLKQGNFEELERHLYEVSDPDHERFGNHLSADEVNELVKPSDETLEAVHTWLEANGIGRHRLGYSPAKDWVNVQLDIATVERLLDTDFSVYRHADGTELLRSLSWSLPTHLHEHVTTVQPVNSFMRALPKGLHSKPFKIETGKHEAVALSAAAQTAAGTNISAVCNTTHITPTCLRTLYGTIDYKPKAAGKNKVGHNNFLSESSNRSDVSIFLQQYRPDAISAAQSFKLISVDGGSVSQAPVNETEADEGLDQEANLDTETILGISYPTPLTVYATGGSPPFTPDAATTSDTNEPYVAWLQYILKQVKDNKSSVPQVISTSYGDDEQTVPASYAKAACSGFAQLGAQGVTLLVSSGDEGVGFDGECFANDGTNRTTFLPEFPASCPYVTTVGATKNVAPEVAAYDTFADGSVFTSGGGFSNYFPRPAYQTAAVQAYLKFLGPTTYNGLYNAKGRAYPDIAAQGQRFATIWDGVPVTEDGTSCSAPTAAGVFSLVNDALLAAGRQPLGFANPLIYKLGSKAFTDILSGSSAGCGGKGFGAAKGWDPVSGNGTPRFGDILKALGLH